MSDRWAFARPLGPSEPGKCEHGRLAMHCWCAVKPGEPKAVTEDNAANAFRFREFQRLWSEYRATLAQPFGKTREEDAQITSRVDAAFQSLDQLAKEG